MWNHKHFKVANKAITLGSQVQRVLRCAQGPVRSSDPPYEFGCKRPSISNDYRTFTWPNVHLETSGIERIEPDGIVASDGTKRTIDALVLATGYDVWGEQPAGCRGHRPGRPQPREVVAGSGLPGLRGHLRCPSSRTS